MSLLIPLSYWFSFSSGNLTDSAINYSDKSSSLISGSDNQREIDFRNCKASCVCESLSHVQLFATPRTVAHQASLSMGFSRQEYWSGLPFPSPKDLPNPGIEPWSPASQGDSLPFELQRSPEKVLQDR